MASTPHPSHSADQRFAPFLFWKSKLRLWLLACMALLANHPTQAQDIPPGPSNFTFCSAENALCGFNGVANVAYGANGQFVFQNLTNGATCSNTSFGTDPAPGVAKACFLPAGPKGYAFCSIENGTCSFNGPANVAYGANGQFVFQSSTNGTTCSNAAFGTDPAEGVVKACFLPAGPPGYRFCSVENTPCNFSGVASVGYGANEQFVFKSFSNSTACNNAVFGTDPDAGVVKACFIPDGPPGYAFCSSENGTCSFAGTSNVAYGANGHFVFQSFNNGAGCNNAVFGTDPDAGVVKACFRPAGSLWGFADLHTHPASHLAFGADQNGENGIIWGNPGLDLSTAAATLASDLRPCAPDIHSGGTADPVRQMTRAQIISGIDSQTGWQHTTSGAPDFLNWPAALSIEHQQMHITAIRRAYDGGLRLLFAGATDSQLLHVLWNNGLLAYYRSILVPDPVFDYKSAVTQLAFIQNFVAHNSSWMQIVTTAAEARQAITQNKLAVVLSLELDSLTWEQMISLAANYQVRGIIPIHLADNAFGGSAVYGDQFNTNTYFLNGTFFAITFDDKLAYRLSSLPQSIQYVDPVGSLKPGDVSPLPPETLNYNSGINGQPGVGGEKNTKGLIAPDQFLALMRNGLLLDVVHMGEASTEGAIQLGEKYQYPLMDSHTGLRDSQSIGPSERFLLLSHAARLAKLGGVLGLGTTGDPPSPLKNPCDMVHLNSCVKVADDAYQQCVAEREASKSVCTAVLSKALDACHSKFCSSRTRLANWVEGYLYALGAMGGRGVALGTDTNGLSPGFPPYSGGLTTYPFTPPAQPGPPNGLGPHPLSRFQLGTRLYDFYADGLANYGLLPDFLESLKELPGEQPVTALNALYRSAEDVIEMWEKVEAATRNIPPLPAPPCSTTECRSCTNQCDANLKACLGPEGPPNKITCSMVYQSCVQSCIVSVPPAPTFSLKSGSYRCPLAVTIAEQDPTTTIFYTTDGTKPTTSSSKYAGPLAVSASKTLNAIAFWSNGTASSASEVVYTCAAPPPSCPSSLPVFCYSDEQGKPVCVASGKTCPIRP